MGSARVAEPPSAWEGSRTIFRLPKSYPGDEEPTGSASSSLEVAPRGSPSGDARGVTPSASASILARPTVTTSTVWELDPTPEELQISARILLHIARQPRYAPSETAPEVLTQAGMAAALGTSQSAVSNALNRLVDGGALQVERSHVRAKMQRLKVYQLTPHGEFLVRQIRESMGSKP